MEILIVLGLPLLGAFLLALFGARYYAAELNAGVSLATLIAVAFLVLRVIRHGPILALHEQFFVDSFNVFLVALTAFVGFTTALFSRPYMRIEEQQVASIPDVCASITACINSLWWRCFWRC